MNLFLVIVGAIVVMSIFGYGFYKLVSNDQPTKRKKRNGSN